MIRQLLGPTDCPEQDGVKRAQHLQKVIRHDLAMLPPMVIAPRKPGIAERKIAVKLLNSIEHPNRLLDDFRPDSVSRKQRDRIVSHE